MARLLDTLLQLDTVARIGTGLLGRTQAGLQLSQAATDLRRQIAPLALHQVAEQPDPKIDLMRIFAAAEAAGLSWPDMRDALNEYHQSTPRIPS